MQFKTFEEWYAVYDTVDKWLEYVADYAAGKVEQVSGPDHIVMMHHAKHEGAARAMYRTMVDVGLNRLDRFVDLEDIINAVRD